MNAKGKKCKFVTVIVQNIFYLKIFYNNILNFFYIITLIGMRRRRGERIGREGEEMFLIRVRILVCGGFELCYCTKKPFECFDFTLLPLCNGYEVGWWLQFVVIFN